MEQLKLDEVLRLHGLWLRDDPAGSRADLRGADLRWANLSGANLSGADLRWANLSGANLSGANLSGANLSGANLSGANLRWANLSGANLRWANLRGANLIGATIRAGLMLGRYVGCATRGDQYTFFAFDSSAEEPFIFAGCRAFLRSEYEAHITVEYPDTHKAVATRACLDYLANLKPF
jgi:hypothetical protein